MGLINLIFALTLFPYSIDIFGGTPYQLFVIISLEFVAMGLLNTLFNIPIHTNFQTLVPNDIRSRVFSARTILLQIGVPFGAFLFGVLLDKISVQFLYLTISILLILRTLLFILFAPKDVYEPKQVAQ